MDKIFKNQCCRPQVTNKGQRKTTQLITHVYHMYICMHYSSTTTITTNGGMSLYLFNQPSVQSYSRLGWLTTRKPMRITGALNNTQKYWSNHGRTTQWTPFMIHQLTLKEGTPQKNHTLNLNLSWSTNPLPKEGKPRKNHTLNLNLSWSTRSPWKKGHHGRITHWTSTFHDPPTHFWKKGHHTPYIGSLTPASSP